MQIYQRTQRSIDHALERFALMLNMDIVCCSAALQSTCLLVFHEAAPTHACTTLWYRPSIVD